jgi:hypothetical protein
MTRQNGGDVTISPWKGMDKDLKDKGEETIIFIFPVVRTVVVVIMEVLLEYGLDINSTNEDGETPLDRYLTYNGGYVYIK